MTNQQAIKIVENMIASKDIRDMLYDYEQDAIYQLIKTARKYDESKGIKPYHREVW